jgi:hypothetical protein
MSTQATNAPEIDPIMERLEDQIGWYDRKSMTNQRYFKRIKIVEIAAAAIITAHAGAQDCGLNRDSVRASKHGRSGSVFGSYTCLGNLA